MSGVGYACCREGEREGSEIDKGVWKENGWGGRWVGWENEWGRLHMFRGGMEGRRMHKGVGREMGGVGE